MLDRYGELLEPDAITRLGRKDPGLVRPTVLSRMLRELEPPSLDEGFASIDVVPFVPEPPLDTHGRAGAAIALSAVADLAPHGPTLRDGAERAFAVIPHDVPCLIHGWREAADEAWRDAARALGAELAARTGRAIEVAVCTHPAGPPLCWCRPPLPGLWVAFAHRRGIDPRAILRV
jgi:hypothetical protein